MRMILTCECGRRAVGDDGKSQTPQQFARFVESHGAMGHDEFSLRISPVQRAPVSEPPSADPPHAPKTA